MRNSLFCLLVCLSLGCFWAGPTRAQSKQDTLQTVLIKDRKQSEQRATQAISADIIQRYRQLGVQDVLQQHSAVFIKNYGVSNMSTISIRGSSAAQTGVYWHGLNINNALSGLSDFSLLPMGLFNRVEVAYGSRPETPGISGAILLENKRPEWQRRPKMEIGLGYESIHNGSAMLAYSFQKANIYNQTQLIQTFNNNRYSFYNAYLPGRDTLEHSTGRSTHIMNHMYFNAGRHTAAWHTWFQRTARDIPPAAFEAQSDAHEKIQSFRNVVDYQYKAPFQFTYSGKLGFIVDRYLYTYPLLIDPMPAHSWQLPAEIKMEKKVDAHRFTGKASLNLMGMQKPTQHQLNRWGVMGTYRFLSNKSPIELNAKLQYERGSWFKVLPVASFLARYTLPGKWNPWSVYSTVYTAYRLPTLNELFYQPGGNRDLKSETGRNIEAGIQYQKQSIRWKINTEWTTYYRRVDNWIAWFGSSILTPHNIAQVDSRGLEGRLEAEWRLKKEVPQDVYIDEVQIVKIPGNTQAQTPLLRLDAHYAYTLSTTRESDIPNDYSIGKQLPYVPRYQVKLNPGVEYHAWSLYFPYQYTGYRFITTDESQWLMPYHLVGIQLGKTWKIEQHYALKTQLACRNIGNVNYETLPGRYMPERTWLLQIQWQWP